MGTESGSHELFDSSLKIPEGEMVILPPNAMVTLVEDHSEDVKSPETMLDPLDMLCRLGRVEKPEDLGKNFITASGSLPGRDEGKSQGRFVVPFPRDYSYMMWALRDQYPFLPARGILDINKYLSMGNNLYRAAEYGRDAHEVRDLVLDEIAQKLTREKHWQWPYHGQIDVASMVIRLVHWVCFHGPEGFDFLYNKYIGKYIGEDGQKYSVLQSLIFREEWLRRRLLSNRDGILEFAAEFDGSHKVQTMEDSPVSHLRKNGEQANLTRGTSSTEVLADTWEALLCLAEIYEYIDPHRSSSSLWSRAQEVRKAAVLLQQQIWKLWIEEDSYFAMGFDRDGKGHLRKLDALKAIPAFILDTRFFTESEHDQRVVHNYVERLFKPDLFCAAGFRTLSSEHPSFSPGRYHLGSIWPFMNFRIAEGLRRQGMPHLARKVYAIIVKTFEHFKMWPELIRGELDGSFKISRYKIRVKHHDLGFEETVNSVPQTLQGWSVSAHIASLKRLQEPLPDITPFEQKILSGLSF